MHRTTIMLPDDLKHRAGQLAQERGVSLAELIRELLEERLAKTAKSWADDPLFAGWKPWDGPDDGPTDMAENHDRYLYDER